MKKITRAKIFFNKVFTKATPITLINELEYAITENKNALSSLKQQYSESKAREMMLENDISNCDKLINGFVQAGVKFHKDADKLDDIAKQHGEAVTLQTSKKQQLEQQRILTKKISDNVTALERSVSENQSKLRLLKSKVEFSNSVQKLQSIKGVNADIDIDQIVDDIELQYNASNIQLEDSSKPDILEECRTITAREDFLNMVNQSLVNEDVF